MAKLVGVLLLVRAIGTVLSTDGLLTAKFSNDGGLLEEKRVSNGAVTVVD